MLVEVLNRTWVGFCLSIGLALTVVPGAAAAPLGLPGCAPSNGAQRCDGLVTTWDGVPLDTTVVLPAGGGAGLPLVVELHGFGNSKYEYLDPASTAYTDNAYAWAKAGYAVLTFTARGLWGSCGTPESRLANSVACARGYIHLADVLVDEGIADPKRIGVTGDSYGGGQSFMFAALRDRVMLPDGGLEPWRSPKGVALSLAAAAPVIPWTDLVGAIAPNGRTSSTAITPPGAEITPVGVFKTSIANAIFAAAQTAVGPGQPVGEPFVPGRPMGYLSSPGLDPDADVTTWVARSDQGEPYTDPGAVDIVTKLRRFHSAYGIDTSHAPPPLFVGAGFTDDIFPVDETLRFVNRMRRDHPAVPAALLFGDFGHQRAANKKPDRDRLLAAIHAWFDRYVRGGGPTPRADVTALTQTCPKELASGGPFVAPTLAALAPGELRFDSIARQTIDSTGGNTQTALAIDPAAGGGDGCTVVDAGTAAGTATYRLPPAPAGGLTLLGAPVVDATLSVNGDAGVTQVASRLWDVSADGRTRRLVARGLYRPSGAGAEHWELHPNGWRFEPGHAPELELLGVDAPYGRPSNGVFSIDVTRLALRLPIREHAAATPRQCRRYRVITLPRPGGHVLRSPRVTVNGHRVRVRGRRVLRVRIDLRRPGRAVRVRIAGRTTSGRAFVRARRYRTCRA